jgi:NAD(P)-dependent dehydrogenase (short-subunit alcohol dehydrogenase family)
MDVEPTTPSRSYQDRGRVEGQRALMGGGDSGIGRAVALAYAREGPTLVAYLPRRRTTPN